MKKIVLFNGSPRKEGNSAAMASAFCKGATATGSEPVVFSTSSLRLHDCRGCLRCNILKHCVMEDDDWKNLHHLILQAQILVFAMPVYFHHVPASMKRLIDRFRCFHHVRITENSLIHTPFHPWKKEIVLLMSMGSPSASEAQPIIQLFEFMCTVLGKENRLHVITATRLVTPGQLHYDETSLRRLYQRLELPLHLVPIDYRRNQEILQQCYELGKNIVATQENPTDL